MATIVEQVKDRVPKGAPNTFSDSDLSYSGLLEDDYTHSKFLTVNYQGKGNNFVLKSKATLDFAGSHYSQPKPKTSSQVKIISNVSGRDVEAKFDNKGGIRLWSEIGTWKLNEKVDVSAKLKTDSTFSRFSASANFETKYKKLNIDTRLHLKNKSHLFLNQKLVYKEKKAQVGAIYKLSLATLLLSKVNLFGVYKYGDYKFYLDHGFTGTGLGRISDIGQSVIAATYKTKKYKYVVRTDLDYANKASPIQVTAGTVAKIDDKTTVRAKIDSKGFLALSGKFDINKNLTVLAGSQVNVTDVSSFTTSSVVPIPLGLTLKFSYL